MSGDAIPTCPRCGNPDLGAYYSCHTWSQRSDDGSEGWMSCLGCCSAIHYYCNDLDDCGWSYEHGLNRHNPRSARNEANRPAWLSHAFADDVALGFVYSQYGGWETEARCG